MSGSVGHKPKLSRNRQLSQQDQRITGRHIKALMDLQDVTLENENLKSKIDIIEKELSSCYQLHEMARSSQRLIEDLKLQHRDELERLEDQLNNYKRKEIAEQQNLHEEEKVQLKKINVQLEKKLRLLELKQNEYEKELVSSSENRNTVKELQEKCESLTNSLVEVRTNVTSLSKERDDLQSELNLSRKANAVITAEMEKQKCRILVLEQKQEEDKRLRERLSDQNFLYKELVELNNNVTTLKGEIKTLEENYAEMTDENKELNRLLDEERSKSLLLEMEKDTVKQSADDLRSDLEFLQNKIDRLNINNLPRRADSSRPESVSKDRKSSLKGQKSSSTGLHRKNLTSIE